MAVQVSDDFTGLAEDDSLNGRTLNNALGGSLSKTWASSNSFGAVGGNKVLHAGGGWMRVDYGSGDAKARFTFTLGGADRPPMIGMRANSTSSGLTSCFVVWLTSSTNLRITEFDGSSNEITRDDQAVTAISTSTAYKIEIEISGLVITGRLLNSDGSVYDSGAAVVTYTAGSTPGASTWITIVDWFTTNPDNYTIDDFVVEDLAGGGGSVFSRIIGGGGGAMRLAGNGGLVG